MGKLLHTGKAKWLLMLLVCLLFTFVSEAQSTRTATIATDALDYPPGSIAAITGSGFDPGETVVLKVVHTDSAMLTDNSKSFHQPWTVVADANGNVSSSWQVPPDQDELGANLLLTADGQNSGLSAFENFTDAVVSSPTISTSGTLSAQSACAGSPSSTTYFSVSGSYLTADILVTAPTGYEISTSSSGPFASTVTLTRSSGSVSTTRIYIRLTGSAANGASGNVSVTSTGATTKNVATGTGVVTAIPTISGIDNNSPVCAGGSLGLSVDAVTGATYSWTGPNSFSSSSQNPTVTSITAGGTFSLTVSVNGCRSLVSTTVATVNPRPSRPSVNFGGGGEGGNSTICENSTLSLTTGSVSGATYSWTGPNSFTSSSQNPSITSATTAASGTYSLIVTGSNGCASQAGTATATVNARPIITNIGSSARPVCAGSTLNFVTGTITAANYSWSGPNSFTSSSQNPSIASVTTAASGVYTLTVSVSGCTNAISRTVVSVTAKPSAPVVSNSGAVCAGGTIGVSANAVTNAAYSWSGPDGFSSSNRTATIDNATADKAGTYSLAVTVNGCTSDAASTTVTVNALPAVTVNSTEICNGTSASLTAGGASTYIWSNEASGAVINVSPSVNTNYIVTGTDANGCSNTATASVTVNALPVLGGVATTDVLCKGNSTGSLILSAPYSENGGLSYAWYKLEDDTDNEAFSNSQNLSGIEAGRYKVILTDAKGCTADGTFTVAQPEKNLSVSLTATNLACNKDNSGAINTTVSGGTEGYAYVWSNEATTADLSNLAAGEYHVTVTDAHGCTTADKVTITEPEVLQAAATATNVVCKDAINGAVNLQVSGGTESYAFAWSNSAASQNLDGVAAGDYSVTVTDAHGCTATANASVLAIDNELPTITAPADITTGTDENSCSATIEDLGTPQFGDNCSGATVSNDHPSKTFDKGTTIITWTVTDAAGNTATATQTVTVNDTQKPIISAPADITVNSGADCSVSVSDETLGAATVSDNCTALADLIVSHGTAKFDGKGEYTIQWSVTDAAGNVSYASQKVTVVDATAPVVPSVNAAVGQCSIDVLAPNALDNCSGSVLGKYQSGLPAGKGSVSADGSTVSVSVPGSYTITWSFTDESGNTSTADQPVTLNEDVTPPTFGEVNEIIINSDNNSCNATNVSLNAPTVSSNCSANGAITVTANTTATTFPLGTTVITWTAKDAMGHSATKTQKITVVDNTAPVPANAVLPVIKGQCSVTIRAPKTGRGADLSDKHEMEDSREGEDADDDDDAYTFPWALDNCAGWIRATTESPLSYTAQGTFTIRWKFDDGHGNISYQDQLVVVADKKAPKPVTEKLAVVTGQCSATITGAAPTAVDNCSGIITGTTTDPLSYNKQGTYYVRWSFDDGHGNISTQTQTVIVKDVTAPVPDKATLSTINAECSVTVTEAPTATDNCTGAVTATTTDPLTFTRQGTYTIRWNFRDGNGNSSTQLQTVVIKDVTAPVVSAPANTTISCGSSSSTSVTGKATATDNCGGTVSITYSDVTVGNVTTRTWTGKDAAGNTGIAVQTITSVDNTAPVVKAPSNTTINCGATADPSSTGKATATDNCSTPVVTYSDATSGNVITRTWTATDASGNSTSAKQTITVGSAFTVSVSSVPTSSTYTGGVATNLYLGYGAQGTALKVGSLPSEGASYTYSWSGANLSSTTSSAPVFTPTASGTYNFMVTVTNKYGCTASASISICVTDVRAAGGLVYVYHVPKSGTPQQLTLAVNQVAQHLSNEGGSDRLGTALIQGCNTPVTGTNALSNAVTVAAKSENAVPASEETLKVTVMPNPSTTYFTLKFESRYQTPVTLRVFDMTGRVIEAKSQVSPNSTIQIGREYISGTYFAEMIQGNTRRTVQLMKIK